MLGLGKEVDDPVQRLIGVVGVQGRNAQVSGFRVGQRLGHGLAVANLADHDDIRRFAHGVFQGVGVIFCVYANLTLIDNGTLVLIQKFDRIFNR